MALAPAEVLIEDRKSVASFLAARPGAALGQPSRNVLHDLVVAVSVGHRRAQRALSLVFEGTEDAPLKRSILRRYAILDQALQQVESGLDEMPPPMFLDMTQSVIESIDGGFQFAYSHIDDVRNNQPEVDDQVDTRPAKPRDPEGTSTTGWFSAALLADEGPTNEPRRKGADSGRRDEVTRRGH